MPLMRQGGADTRYDPKAGISIASLAYEYPRDYRVPDHAHGSDQIIYATSGAMEVAVGQSLWLIPPQFAIWIPARRVHRIRMPSAVSMRTLYLKHGLAPFMPQQCRVLHVTPLLRELIVEAVHFGKLRQRDPLHRALRDLILAQLKQAPPIPIFLTLPKDRRALAVTNALLTDLARNQSFGSLCARAGASVRTMERLFRREVGTDFETWRRQARLVKAVEKLLTGASVKEVAFAVGYRRSSAFVSLFRAFFGTTPKAWVSSLEKPR